MSSSVVEPAAGRVACAAQSPLRAHVLRLRPGADLLMALRDYASREGLRAACVLTCVGSLSRATLRYANQRAAAVREGPFEICSLVGTLGVDAAPHLHASLSDGAGAMLGGHVLAGCTVFTTAEVVLGEATAAVFDRPVDPETSYDELRVVAAAGAGAAAEAAEARPIDSELRDDLR